MADRDHTRSHNLDYSAPLELFLAVVVNLLCLIYKLDFTVVYTGSSPDHGLRPPLGGSEQPPAIRGTPGTNGNETELLEKLSAVGTADRDLALPLRSGGTLRNACWLSAGPLISRTR